MAIYIDSSSVAGGWFLRNWSPVRAAARGMRASVADLPEPLRDSTKFEPTDQFQAEIHDIRRGSDVLTPLRVRVDAVDGFARIAVARHESGAISFHLAESTPRLRGRLIPTDSKQITFVIPVQAGMALTGVRRGLLGKVIRVVVVKVLDIVAKPVMQVLARHLEERSWEKAGRSEGWLRITQEGIATGQFQPTVPDPEPGRPALLLLHGTFSHTYAAFKHLLNSSAMAELRSRYGNHIYGFDHFTISKSPEENASQLLEGIKENGCAFDCISHSRGGLLLRTLVAAGSNKLTIRRAVSVASPNVGTPLATPRRWEDTLGWFANLMELFPNNPMTTVSGWIAGGLSWLAQHVTGDLPGLSSMDQNGETIASLSGVPDRNMETAWCAIASDYTPMDSQLIARLADMGIEQFFAGPTDLVVPTAGCWQFDTAGANGLAPSQVACFGKSGNISPASGRPVHHLNLFEPQETRDLILKALAGSALGVPRFGATGTAARRDFQASAAEAEPAAQRPGEAADSKSESGDSQPAKERKGMGWDDEDALNLIVLPPPPSHGPEMHRSAQLLATYGSARVLAPFRLGGDTEGAGTKWQRIIAFQHRLNDCAEGRAEGDLTPEQLREGGAVMFDVLFQNDVRRLYDQARFQHRRRKLNVVFTSMIPWVADLPWELAYDPSCKSFLALSDVRFVRNVLTPVPADRIDPTTGPLRILVVSSVPKGQQQLSEDEERLAILRSFSKLVECGLAVVEPLVRASPSKLHAKVRVQGATYDVVHFIGHGDFNEETQTGYLIFEDGRGGTSRIDTDAARNILRGRGIRLLFLNACVSARGSRADYNKGMAPGLVADGVPAVVANQYSVLDRSATMFAKHFYWCLVQGLSLGDAMRESRIALNYLVAPGLDWAVPVLFARNPNAMLCTPDSNDAANLYDAEEQVPVDPSTEQPIGSAPSAYTPAVESRFKIGVWDVADSLPNLEAWLTEMTAAQESFEFAPENLTAPIGTWEVRAVNSPVHLDEHITYLTAERIAKKMKNIVATLGVDLLLCVTNLPLRDHKTLNIYLWTGSADDPSTDLRQNPIAIFSTWGFDPPITGERLGWALANVAVQAIVSTFGDAPASAPKGSIAYYNGERDVEGVVGPLGIDPKTRAMLGDWLTPNELKSLERILRLYHPDSAKTELKQRRGRKRAVKKRATKRR